MSVDTWRRRLYPCAENQNPVRIFTEQVERALAPDMRAIELGAGAGAINSHDVRHQANHLVGVDLSPRVGTNTLLDSAVVADLGQTPFQSHTFDIAFAIYVLEHIGDPSPFLAELRRLLKPGGIFLALTPNKFHYVAAVAKFTPHRFHEWFNTTGTRGNAHEDTFPTYYRLNSRSDLKRHFLTAGFHDIAFTMIEVQPNYLLWSTPAFLAGAAYERVVNRSHNLAGLRVNIVVQARAV